MTTVAADFPELVSEFVERLQDTLRLQEAAARHFQGMAEAVKVHDESALRRILEEAAATLEQSAGAAQARAAATLRLAEAMGCLPEEVTLARLARRVPPEMEAALESHRLRLAALAGDLRRRHQRVSALLGECARLNRAMLLGLLPDTESMKTYGRRGGSRGPCLGLLDARS